MTLKEAATKYMNNANVTFLVRDVRHDSKLVSLAPVNTNGGICGCWLELNTLDTTLQLVRVVDINTMKVLYEELSM
jgi:hypothetical protein